MRHLLQTGLFGLLLAATAVAPSAQPAPDFTWISAGGPYVGTADFVHFDYAILALHRGGVSRTDDGGRTWNRLPDAPVGLQNARREPGVGTVFASDDGLVVTNDAGRTWQRLGPDGVDVSDHTRDPDGALLAIGREDGGDLALYRLGPGGWEIYQTGIPAYSDFAWLFAIGTDGRLGIVDGLSFSVSTDDGATWTRENDQDFGRYTDVVELSDGRVALSWFSAHDMFGTSGGVHFFTAGGDARFAEGIGPSFGLTEAFGDLYVGTEGAAYRVGLDGETVAVYSGDRVRDFVPEGDADGSEGAVFSTESFFEPVLDPPVPHFPRHGVYRVQETGEVVQRGIEPAVITSLTVDIDGRLTVGTGGGAFRLFGTLADGTDEQLGNDTQRWQRLGYDEGAVYNAQRYNTLNLYLDDGGWRHESDYCGVGKAYDAAYAGGYLLVVLGHNWYWTDGGIARVPFTEAICGDPYPVLENLVLGDWDTPTPGLREIERVASGVVLAGAHDPVYSFDYDPGSTESTHPIYYSADDGLTWTAASLDGDPQVYDFRTNDDGQIWAGTDDGLLLAEPDGSEWTQTQFLRGRAVYDLHRGADDALLAGTDAGVFRFDGAEWQPYGQGLEDRKVFAFRSLGDGTLVAGTDRGVWSSRSITSVAAEPTVRDDPQATTLGRPFPNPATDRLTIPVSLASTASARVEVLDVLGRVVVTVDLGMRSVGTHPATVEAERLAAGFYVARLLVDGAPVQTRRFTVAH
jgi:photosystem II stability/assembly factor-like uncharacterized protein